MIVLLLFYDISGVSAA